MKVKLLNLGPSLPHFPKSCFFFTPKQLMLVEKMNAFKRGIDVKPAFEGKRVHEIDPGC